MKRRRFSRVEAFTDESGHTGLNLFDAAQPWFWTGTLLSPVPFEERGGALIRELQARVGEPFLHAKSLGIAKIETIAKQLNEFLEDLGARYVFTAIEKRHVATGKLADTLLDSTMNKAVSPVHYGVHGSRIILAHVIEDLTTSARDQEEFWSVYSNGDADGLSRILNRLLVRLNAIPGVNPRLREILSDALRWGMDHPQELLDFRRSELDAPNLIAFTLLMDGIRQVLEGTGLKVGRFVHDEQQQFGQFMREWYQLLRRFTMPTHVTALYTDIRRIQTYDCAIEMPASRDVAGLQIIDLVLWLYRRSITNGMREFPACAALVQSVDRRARVRHHSKDQLARDSERAYREIMAMPIHENSRVLVEKIEQARKDRMRTQ